MSDLFAGKVAWITGGGTGLGKGMALELARQGADVAISGRRLDRIEEVAAEIEALGRRGLAVVCDVRDEAQIEAAVARVVDELGGLDVVIANAGMSVSGPVTSVSAEGWRRQLDINVVGVALTARHTIAHLTARKGRFAIIGSVSGRFWGPFAGPYQASKAAAIALGHTLAAELHGTGVSCTTINPGFVHSDIAKIDRDGHYDPDREDRRPAWLMWPTDRAARVMIRAIRRRKLEYTFTGHGRLAVFFGQHLPRLVHWIVRSGTSKREADKTVGPAPGEVDP